MRVLLFGLIAFPFLPLFGRAAVTAQALNADMQNCLDAGMDDYITKPVSPDMIEVIYRRYAAARLEKIVA